MAKKYAIAFKLNAILGNNYARTFEKAESKAQRWASSLDRIGKRATLLSAPIKALG